MEWSADRFAKNDPVNDRSENCVGFTEVRQHLFKLKQVQGILRQIEYPLKRRVVVPVLRTSHFALRTRLALGDPHLTLYTSYSIPMLWSNTRADYATVLKLQRVFHAITIPHRQPVKSLIKSDSSTTSNANLGTTMAASHFCPTCSLMCLIS
jgi:hypothetical protein